MVGHSKWLKVKHIKGPLGVTSSVAPKKGAGAFADIRGDEAFGKGCAVSGVALAMGAFTQHKNCPVV